MSLEVFQRQGIRRGPSRAGRERLDLRLASLLVALTLACAASVQAGPSLRLFGPLGEATPVY